MKIFGIAGYKNSGKTGLTERLVAEFTTRGLRVSTVKHTHHRVDLDKPGKDSHRHREAGAQEVLIVSENRWALLHELRETPEPPLETLLPKLSPVDLVLVEGYKSGPHPRIEAHRRAVDVRAEVDAVVGDLVDPGQREDLVAAAVGQDRPIPGRKTVQAAQ